MQRPFLADQVWELRDGEIIADGAAAAGRLLLKVLFVGDSLNSLVVVVKRWVAAIVFTLQ